MIPCCADCRYFERLPESRDKRKGECWFEPPRATLIGRSIRPVVETSDWCGRFVPLQ